MGPYGSVWADIKTGRSPMAQDHFKTPRVDFFPTNPDLANILGRIDLKIENFYFFNFWTPSFWISRFQNSGPRARTKFLDVFFAHIRRSDSWKYFSPIFVSLIMVYLSQFHRESIVNPWWMYRGHVPDANSFSSLKNWIYENHEDWSEMCPYGSIWLDTAAKMIVRTLSIFFVFKKH